MNRRDYKLSIDLFHKSIMRIEYGNELNYIDVTESFLKTIRYSSINIPASDFERCKITGCIPCNGIIRILDSNNIFIISQNDSCDIYLSEKESFIIFNAKIWYHKIGKNILDVNERLKLLQTKLKIKYGSFQDEYPEQLISMNFLTGKEKILEIGGNIGRNSLILSTILEDESNLVVLEPNTDVYMKLKENIKLNDYNTHIENKAISKYKLYFKGWDTKDIKDIEKLDGWNPVDTITFQELEVKHNIKFDTIVADCEGAFYYILKDDNSILDCIKTFIVENDYHSIEHKKYVEGVLRGKGFTDIYNAYHDTNKGERIESFYQVWRKN